MGHLNMFNRLGRFVRRDVDEALRASAGPLLVASDRSWFLVRLYICPELEDIHWQVT